MNIKKILLCAASLGCLWTSVDAMDMPINTNPSSLKPASKEFIPGLAIPLREFVPGQGLIPIGPTPPVVPLNNSPAKAIPQIPLEAPHLQLYRPSHQEWSCYLFKKESHPLLFEILQRELSDTKHMHFQTSTSLNHLLEIINALFCYKPLALGELNDAYSIATTLRHEKNFISQATKMLEIIISAPQSSNLLKSQSYRGLAKIESRTNNSLQIIIDHMQKAIDLYPQSFQNYLWLGNVPKIDPKIKIDNLEKALRIAKTTIDPTIKAKILLKLASINHRLTTQDKTSYYLESLKLLGQNGDHKLITRAYMGLASAEHKDRNYKGKIRWLEKALEIQKKDGDPNLLAQIYIDLYNAKSANTHKYLQEALKIIGKNGKPYLVAQIYNGFGLSHYKDDTHKSQADWILDALKVLEGTTKYELLAITYINLGNSQYPDGRANAQCYLKVFDILGPDGSPDILAQACNGLGYCQYTDKNHRNQAAWHLEALEIIGPNGRPEQIAQAYIGLGNIEYYDRNLQVHGLLLDIQSNEEWYEMALEILGENGKPELRAHAYTGLGNAAGDNRNNEEAIKWFKKALELTPWDKRIKAKIERCEKIIKSLSKNNKKP